MTAKKMTTKIDTSNLTTTEDLSNHFEANNDSLEIKNLSKGELDLLIDKVLAAQKTTGPLVFKG